jgi:hypothetical protein
MPKFSECFFCPSPWDHLYYHIHTPSPCHLIRSNPNMSAQDYINSDWLKNIKTDFLEGRVPKECKDHCKAREDLGLKSTRGAWYNVARLGKDIEIDTSGYNINDPVKIKRLELRLSNLCNFKCRMCNEDSSSEIVKEKQAFNIPFHRDT